MSGFQYQEPLPIERDTTEYELLTADHVSVQRFGDREMLVVEPEALTLLAREAMKAVNFYLRPAHQEKVAAILDNPLASENDIFVARTMLENSVIAAEGTLPICQDTGTATVVGKKGQNVFTGCNDGELLSAGIYATYQAHNLRYSQVVPLTMYEEKNSGTNLPAQIDLYATEGETYKFTFIAKGGGSANKTYLFQKTKALLNPESLERFLVEQMKTLGTAACPPYHVAFVVGGTSAETNLKIVKLASIGELDHLPTTGNMGGQGFRDVDLEAKLLKAAHESGIGAQFGGVAFAHDIRVIRLPRHGASCPVGMGVSCSADRNVRAKINRDGIWLEKLEHNPARLLTQIDAGKTTQSVAINLDQPMAAIRAELSKHPVKTRVALTGTMIVGRDIAHAKFKALLDAGEPLPDYLKNHPIYYAGPAKKPDGMPSGSFGPTTANRMDPYVNLLQSNGGSYVMIAKGNRSAQVTEACKTHGGFYLGSIGGPAAHLAKNCIKSVEVLDYPELGMEAVWRIEVVDFPAFILVDDKGNDFFATL